jgi:hypothetical protein
VSKSGFLRPGNGDTAAVGPAVLRFFFTNLLKSNSTRLGLQYSIFQDVNFSDVLKASSIRVIALPTPGINAQDLPLEW